MSHGNRARRGRGSERGDRGERRPAAARSRAALDPRGACAGHQVPYLDRRPFHIRAALSPLRRRHGAAGLAPRRRGVEPAAAEKVSRGGPPMRRIFLLSPANCNGARARWIVRPNARSELALRLRGPAGAPLGEVFAVFSALYFRGKLAYARAFARPPVTAEKSASWADRREKLFRRQRVQH